jgi:hypothetical protein
MKKISVWNDNQEIKKKNKINIKLYPLSKQLINKEIRIKIIKRK